MNKFTLSQKKELTNFLYGFTAIHDSKINKIEYDKCMIAIYLSNLYLNRKIIISFEKIEKACFLRSEDKWSDDDSISTLVLDDGNNQSKDLAFSIEKHNGDCINIVCKNVSFSET